jgi:hypothetical protein
MEFNFDFTFHAISTLTSIIAWLVLALFAYRIYKKQMVRPKIWKVVLVIYAGIFSFSFNWTMFDTMVKIPILPLGVWVLYFVLNRKDDRWRNYRPFAWLGFWSNFLFLASTLIAIPVHHMIYPKEDPSTYLSNIENASITYIHPSAEEQKLNKETLIKQLHSMKKDRIYSEQWYEDLYMNPDSDQNERFPYQLIGTSPKWGSGLHSIIFIEKDGKGLLLSSPKNQLYFRSENSFLEGVEKSDE